MQEQLPRNNCREGLGEEKLIACNSIFFIYWIIKRILKKRIVWFLLTPPSPAGEGLRANVLFTRH
ncbi:MAG: hypothetical protein KAT04_12505, partial [Methylococcales bacterium]|nr:hypothetical protein [Methylococcales bacterium]